MLRLYDDSESENADKVRLLLDQLELPFQRIELDILQGKTRTPEFRALNPNQRVPLLECPAGACSRSPTPSCSSSPRTLP